MKKTTSRFLSVGMVAVLFAGCAVTTVNAQSTVRVIKTSDGFQLTRNEQPYQIKGVGGNSHFAELVKAGGNSVRTWGAEQLEKTLDEAHKHGLTVCAGLWLGHPRHGFDYSDRAAVQKQMRDTVAVVQKYKNHPAILMWGIGNEMEADGTDLNIWKAVNDIAREVKRIDPNHPTMTVIAELGEREIKVKNLERYCPDIDIVGLNSYGGISSLADRYQKAAATKPYIVTEHGPIGPWETGKTSWGSPFEPSSTQKGTFYADGYRIAVAEQPDLCLGSYAFLWGNKQETTATWFGMLLPDGTRLAPVDAMREAWTGTPPANRCPLIESLTLDKTENLKPGSMIHASVTATDTESDTLTVKWVLRSDSATIGEGGDAQNEEAAIRNVVDASGDTATITVPTGGGGYRLFAYVYDGHGGAAVANVPLFVEGPVMTPKSNAPTAKLPFSVYSDDSNQTVYVPSGYMGNAAAVTMQEDSTDEPHSGSTCLKVEYKSRSDWAGVLWQSPANDWEGTKPGGANLTGATHLEFWVRGEAGGETVNFVFGVIDGDQPFRDTAKGELKDLKLPQEWQKHTLSLDGLDLSRIKTGFGWSLAANGKPVTFYLDDIRYVAQ